MQSRIKFGHQLEAARNEWFIQDTEQALFATDSGAANAGWKNATGPKGLKKLPTATASPPRIAAPASGSILTPDPDIPPKNQHLTFSAEGQNLRWRMDGKEFARGVQAQWPPWPSRHVVQLLDASENVAGEIRLEVRGPGVKPPAGRQATSA